MGKAIDLLLAVRMAMGKPSIILKPKKSRKKR